MTAPFAFIRVANRYPTKFSLKRIRRGPHRLSSVLWGIRQLSWIVQIDPVLRFKSQYTDARSIPLLTLQTWKILTVKEKGISRIMFIEIVCMQRHLGRTL